MDKLGPYLLGPNDVNQGIYTGDARVLSEAIPNESVDIIFTSPPYNTGIKYENWQDNLPEKEFWNFQKHWLSDAFRLASPTARLYAVVGDNILWDFKPIAEKQGWHFHQMLIWCKPNLVGGGRITKDWNLTAEWCLLFHKGKRTSMKSMKGVVTHNWIVEASTQSNFSGWLRKVHPAQLPLRVAFSWLSRTPGNVVFDPFVGSGTTAQAAKLLGKKWLAFEIGPETANLARERVQDTKTPLFVFQEEQLAFDDFGAETENF